MSPDTELEHENKRKRRHCKKKKKKRRISIASQYLTPSFKYAYSNIKRSTTTTAPNAQPTTKIVNEDETRVVISLVRFTLDDTCYFVLQEDYFGKMVVAFCTRAWILGEFSTIHFPPALFKNFFLWRLARAH